VNRVSRRLIIFVYFVSVIVGDLIVTIVFSFIRINHMVLSHLHWSSFYMLADHHIPNIYNECTMYYVHEPS
jgi:hypothetical protein